MKFRYINVVSVLSTMSQFVPSVTFAIDCSTDVVNDGNIYMAISSVERGYHLPQDVHFQAEVLRIAQQRAGAICQAFQCGPPLSQDLDLDLLDPRGGGWTNALVVNSEGQFEEQSFEQKLPWHYLGPSHQAIADFCWYGGHLISIGSIASSFLSHNVSGYVTAPCVILGQSMTIISRPISRMKQKEISAEKALDLIGRGKSVEKRHRTSGRLVPHQVFRSLHCTPLEVSVVN